MGPRKINFLVITFFVLRLVDGSGASTEEADPIPPHATAQVIKNKFVIDDLI